MTAFDGPGPFDGDAVYHYVDQAELSSARLRTALVEAFDTVLQGGVARQIPPELLSMVGMKSAPAYVDVDDAVWAWASAELVALAMGHEPETPIPGQFADPARSLSDPALLVDKAVEALRIISVPEQSELAGLLKESGDRAALERIRRLEATLRG